MTITGAKMSEVKTFEQNRILHTSQYGCDPQWFIVTKAESRKDERKGPRTPPQANNTARPRILSNRFAEPASHLIAAAPINASDELLTNQQRIIRNGTPPCNSVIKWAGKAHRSKNHHLRAGLNSRAPNKIELGGHITETG